MHLFVSKRLGWGIRVGVVTGSLLTNKRCSPHPLYFLGGFFLGLYLLLHFIR